MTLPRAVIYDWDNTLMDTFPVIFAGHNLVREKLGHAPWSEDEARANIRLAAKDAFPRWYGDRAVDAQTIYVDYIRAHHLQGMTLFDGSEALLDHLHGRGVAQAVVSNKRGEFLRAEIAAAGWDRYFGAVVGATDIEGPGKPDPAGLNAAIATLGIAQADRHLVWYVGDTENDLKTAVAAGVKPVFIENHPMSEPDDITAQNPAFAFKNPRECLAYLLSLG